MITSSQTATITVIVVYGPWLKLLYGFGSLKSLLIEINCVFPDALTLYPLFSPFLILKRKGMKKTGSRIQCFQVMSLFTLFFLYFFFLNKKKNLIDRIKEVRRKNGFNIDKTHFQALIKFITKFKENRNKQKCGRYLRV